MKLGRGSKSWLTGLLAGIAMTLAPGASSAQPLNLSMRQQECTALAIYWEARGKPPLAQVAVAHVIRNRIQSGVWPTTPCAVVFQRDRRRCQFDFACRRGQITDPRAWREAQQMATVAQRLPDVTNGATYFHASYVRPNWRNLRRVAHMGGNVFYAERRTR